MAQLTTWISVFNSDCYVSRLASFVEAVYIYATDLNTELIDASSRSPEKLGRQYKLPDDDEPSPYTR